MIFRGESDFSFGSSDSRKHCDEILNHPRYEQTRAGYLAHSLRFSVAASIARGDDDDGAASRLRKAETLKYGRDDED